MAFPIIFTNLASPAQLSDFDTMFNLVGSMGQIMCTASGTNAITLTPIANMPTVSSYANYQLFGFVAPNTTTSSVTANAGGGSKPVYITGTTQAGSGSIPAASYVLMAYNSALNSGGGGFQILSLSSGSNTQQSLLGSASNVSCSITVAGVSATFTADEIILGASLGGTSVKIGSFSQAINLSTTGAGGMDTGTAPVSGFVAIYAIQGASGTNILACNVTTSSGTIYSGANLPSGYTNSALIGIWPTNGSSQFVIGNIAARQFYYNAGVQILSAGSATSWTSITLASAVPPTAKSVQGTAITSTNNGQQLSLSPFASPNSATFSFGSIGLSNGFLTTFSCPILTSQTIYYQVSNNAYSATAVGYTF